MKRAIFAATAIILGATGAQATLIDYKLNGSLSNGQAISGGFRVDDTKSSISSFSDIAIVIGPDTLDRLNIINFLGNPDGVSPFQLLFRSSTNSQPSFILEGTGIKANFTLTDIPSGTFTGSYRAAIGQPTFQVSSGAAVVTRLESAVPEPATWAMFIGGFGLIGAAMRRRQRVNVSFA